MTAVIWVNDPLAARVNQRPRAVDIDAFQWKDQRVPAGVARPAVMLPIIAGRRVPATLLLGAHVNGTSLDPDEIRSIRRLLAEAAVVYGNSPAPDWKQGAYVGQPSGI